MCDPTVILLIKKAVHVVNIVDDSTSAHFLIILSMFDLFCPQRLAPMKLSPVYSLMLSNLGGK